MRYQVMTRVLGRGVEQIGEAELPDPLGLRAVGRFIPGPGYARVRDVFLLRKQGKRDAYRDGRVLLQLRLYLDGLPMHSVQIDIDDPDRIEVELNPYELVDGPAVGSLDELSEALVWHCPQCGTSNSQGITEYALPGSRFAAQTTRWCPTCRKSWRIMFPAKPGWRAP